MLFLYTIRIDFHRHFKIALSFWAHEVRLECTQQKCWCFSRFSYFKKVNDNYKSNHDSILHRFFFTGTYVYQSEYCSSYLHHWSYIRLIQMLPPSKPGRMNWPLWLIFAICSLHIESVDRHDSWNWPFPMRLIRSSDLFGLNRPMSSTYRLVWFGSHFLQDLCTNSTEIILHNSNVRCLNMSHYQLMALPFEEYPNTVDVLPGHCFVNNYNLRQNPDH